MTSLKFGQFLTPITPSPRLLLRRSQYCCHKIIDPLPSTLRQCCHLWTTSWSEYTFQSISLWGILIWNDQSKQSKSKSLLWWTKVIFVLKIFSFFYNLDLPLAKKNLQRKCKLYNFNFLKIYCEKLSKIQFKTKYFGKLDC